MVHADASQGSEGREHDFHPQSRLQGRGSSTSMVTGSARVLRGGPPHPHPRWALQSQFLKLDRPYGERARTSEAPDGPWIVRGFAGGQIVTATSATTPCWATTLRSTTSAFGANVRTVHSPGAAKKRKCPVAEVGTSAVNSPDRSSSRTYAFGTGCSSRVTTPWITDSFATLTPSRETPPAVAPHISPPPPRHPGPPGRRRASRTRSRSRRSS